MIKTIKKAERKVGEMKFYCFDQNNSGGSFTVDENLCHRLIVEAESEAEAERIAEGMGVYFNGCEDGYDCECCGDRWYSPSEMEIPYRYGAFTKDDAQEISEKYMASVTDTKYKHGGDRKFDVLFSIEQYAQYMADNYGWTSPDVRIFYKDGTVKEVYSDKVRR